MLLIAGASAITDRHDVLPAGIVAAGGALEHFGMPVDPGNLLLLARLDGRPGAGPARLLPLAQAQRPRLGAAAAGRRHRGHRARHHGHGRGRPAERDPLAPAAARGRAAGDAGQGRRPWSWPPASRGAWAAPTSCCSRSPASRWSATSSRLRWPRAPAPVVVVLGHQQHEVRQALRGLKVRFAAQPRLCGGPQHLPARRPRRPAAGRRRRRGLPGRHAAGQRRH